MIAGDLLGERARLTPDALALVTVPRQPVGEEGATRGGRPGTPAGGPQNSLRPSSSNQEGSFGPSSGHPAGPQNGVAAPQERLTYRQLNARTEACARLLTDVLGLQPGDRAGILAGNRVEYLEAFFACGKTGTTLVPIGTRLTAAEILHVVADSGLSALLYSAEHAPRVRELCDLLAPAQPPWLVALDEADADNPLEALDYRRQRDQLLGAPTSRPWPRLDGEHLWALLYTSGTTGKPKGVMIPHRQVLWNGYNTVVGWQLRADDVTPIFTPLYHAGGLGAFLVPIITIGGTVVLLEEFDAAQVWRTLEAEGCTVVLGVPTIFERLAEAPEMTTADLSRVRWFISGGAPLPRYLIDRYQARGIGFKQGYGLTEVGVNCFAMTLEDSVARAGSIGKPLPFTEARLADAEGREIPPERPDEVGELWLRGPHVCRGYWQQPAATASALDAEGWFHTGDLARRDADGFFTIAGRAKDMLISGGVNVYPAEIEGALLLHPQVRDAAVVGVPDPRWGEAGIAFLVAGPEGPPEEDELRAHLGRHLAKYKHPRGFVYRTELPRTAYGKVVKGELRQSYLQPKETSP